MKKLGRLTVAPHERETKEEFKIFREEDVRDMFIYACLFQTLTALWRLRLIRENLSPWFFVIQLIITLAYWSVQLAIARFK